ncbi:YciI family protein [Dyella sp. 2HG41-7]|uniref:YciI family protein n=1 Tax=Dyella sp. 2HG41-7 TaxID=2883239 RepID=UPI001F3CD059|nr:YciI family protein [Dyella sp. 2HG41-7]
MNRYLVMMMRRPQCDPAVVPQHREFLQSLRDDGSLEMTGGFSDKSGGAYLLRAESMDAAREIVHRDPAHTSGGWDVTVYEWNTY